MAGKAAEPSGVLIMGTSIPLGASSSTYVDSLVLPSNVTLHCALNTTTIAPRATWPSSGTGAYEPGMMPRLAELWTDPLTIVRYATSSATIGGVLNTQFEAVKIYYTTAGLQKPDCVILNVGENDVQTGDDLNLYRTQLTALVIGIHMWAPNARILIQLGVIDDVAGYPQMTGLRVIQQEIVDAYSEYCTIVERTDIEIINSSNPHYTLAGQTTCADNSYDAYQLAL